MSIPVILDTDIGSDIDDTWALVMLLRCPELDLKLVLTDTADTVYRAKLTAKLLELAGRSEIPIGIGIRGEAKHEYQQDWVGSYDLHDYPGAIHEDGVQAMIDMIRTSPDPITIIGIAPAPNLERALKLAPDIAPRCRFVGMFGSVERGYEEDSEPIAETNVREAVSAAQAIFAAPWREIIITPLDTCGKVILQGEWYGKITEADDPVLQAVIENYRIWAGLVPWVEIEDYTQQSSILFDTVAVYLGYSQDLLNVEEVGLRVTEEGLTVRDDSAKPIQVALSWHDLEGFYDHLVERLLS